MDKILTYMYRGIVLVLLVTVAAQFSSLRYELNKSQNEFQLYKSEMELKLDSISRDMDTLKVIHPWKHWKSRKWSGICRSGTFLGHLVYGKVDTSCHPEFKSVLTSYNGPKLTITSLKRHKQNASFHNHGKAVDVELDDEVIDYLISEKGQNWLKENNLLFYIEGKPGSKRVSSYKDDPLRASYVFFNKWATGDHLHIQFRKNV